MDISVKKVNKNESNHDDFLINVEGEIDVYTAPELKKKLIPLTERSGARVTLDLSATEYMDSTGLGIIIAGLKSAESHRSLLEVKGMTPRVKRLFSITGLMDILNNKNLIEGESR